MNPTKLPGISNVHRSYVPQLDLPPRLLLGPGPANVHPRVLQTLGMQSIGHLDPKFIELMDEVQELLRYLWQTENALTLPISGTGTAAMEAAVANVVEPGDVVLVGVNGYFGERLCQMIHRYGGKVRRMEAEWGDVFRLSHIYEALGEHRPALLALVHGETSTGALQPLDGVGDLCREYDALLLVDSVASLGAVPLYVDAWGIDVCYSASQKCLGAPPGLAPLTLNERALDKIKKRNVPVRSWYLDLTLLADYWQEPHIYHHTAPVNLNYALREALRLIAEEGLSECWQRHRNNAELLWLGLADLDLECHVLLENRLPSLTTVKVPGTADAQAVARHLLTHYNIDIAQGLGQLQGDVWRIGLMGFNSRAEIVTVLLKALEEALTHAR